MTDLHVTDVRLTPAGPRDRDTGLLGYIELVLNGTLALDGVTLRCTAAGRRYLSFPARTDRAGERHHYARPLGEGARLELERQVLEALQLEEVGE